MKPDWIKSLESALRDRLSVENLELSTSPTARFDLYATGRPGEDYFIEIRPGPLNRLGIGRVLEQRATLLKERQTAKIVLICLSVDSSVSNLLEKAGIKTFTFSQLGIEKPLERKKRETRLHLSPSEQRAYFALLRAGKKIIRTKDFQSLMMVPAYRAKNTLASLGKHGALFRVGRGKYSVISPDILYERKSYTADPLTILDSLMDGQEYYVAYGSAAHLHGVTDEIPFLTFVAVTRQRRSIDMGSTKIRFVSVKSSRFFGKTDREYFASRIFLSNLEKTLIDCFDRSDLVGGIESVTKMLYNALQKLEFSKLIHYAKRMQKKAMLQRLGFVLEKLSRIRRGIPVSALKEIENVTKIKFRYLLDPKVRKKGRFSEHWLIYENIDCLRWFHG